MSELPPEDRATASADSEDAGVLLALAGKDDEAVRALDEALAEYTRLGQAEVRRAPANDCASWGYAVGTGEPGNGPRRAGRA